MSNHITGCVHIVDDTISIVDFSHRKVCSSGQRRHAERIALTMFGTKSYVMSGRLSNRAVWVISSDQTLNPHKVSEVIDDFLHSEDVQCILRAMINQYVN